MKKYLLVDSGDGKKLESLGGGLKIIRPCPVAVWKPSLSKKLWDEAVLEFSRDGENRWSKKIKNEKRISESLSVDVGGIDFKISFTDFGHLGIFPEHANFFDFIQKKVKSRENPNVLNLFAYTGAISLAAAKAGAKVCHLDASKPSILWAKENAKLNGLENAPIRWILDDAIKFLKRECKRKVKYDAIVLDPPTFGRGAKGEVFKIERDFYLLLDLCREVLSKDPLFLIVTSHSPGFTPTVLSNAVRQIMKKGSFDAGENFLKPESSDSFVVPSGSYLIWEPKK